MRGVTNSAGVIGGGQRAEGTVSADVMPSATNQGGGIRPSVCHQPACRSTCIARLLCQCQRQENDQGSTVPHQHCWPCIAWPHCMVHESGVPRCPIASALMYIVMVADMNHAALAESFCCATWGGMCCAAWGPCARGLMCCLCFCSKLRRATWPWRPCPSLALP